MLDILCVYKTSVNFRHILADSYKGISAVLLVDVIVT